jgi:nitroimidazol reductase NimA-like FMN-containing flavoprotein (pyridoxamine 5'-phosphate oxidase superfamily)
VSDDRAAQLRRLAEAAYDSAHFLVLGTTEADGSARVSPVYHDRDGDDLYWVSAPSATHSVNLTRDPRATAVVFDSTAHTSRGGAVYVTGTAALVPDDELEAACAVAFAHPRAGAIAFTPEDLSGERRLRLYRLRAETVEVHLPGGHDLGSRHDGRGLVPPS